MRSIVGNMPANVGAYREIYCVGNSMHCVILPIDPGGCGLWHIDPASVGMELRLGVAF